ncbi:hypothetical protein A6g_01365 [Bacillus velezensis]|nr:hypothetical protein P42_09510 [Bacillus velezensis]RXK33516.1 hypothetical protein A6g_01365 [Bacillus velezensis]
MPPSEKGLWCRDSQGFPSSEIGRQRPAWAVGGAVQKCRKRGLFRAEAWRGDDCARQIARLTPTEMLLAPFVTNAAGGCLPSWFLGELGRLQGASQSARHRHPHSW